MFYYLLYKSSLFNNQESDAKKISILLYGSITYIVIHAFINFTQNNTLMKLKPYFWSIWILDIIITLYNIYQVKEDIEVSDIFNLKNSIKDLLNNTLTKKKEPKET